MTSTQSALTAPDMSSIADLEIRWSNVTGRDYYEVLDLPHTATAAEIKKAFYRESRAYHPDRFYQLDDAAAKELVSSIYKRVTEAYFVLRDDKKRAQYLANINGPEREQKLRFDENSETETKQAARKQAEEEIGTTPKGRQFFQTGQQDFDAQRWAAAERNFKMAVTYEPSNARYKERLAEAQSKIASTTKKADPFKIR